MSLGQNMTNAVIKTKNCLKITTKNLIKIINLIKVFLSSILSLFGGYSPGPVKFDVTYAFYFVDEIVTNNLDSRAVFEICSTGLSVILHLQGLSSNDRGGLFAPRLYRFIASLQ